MSNCVNKETCIEYARLGENTECYLCPDYKAPMSNADCIRAMDDEKLAIFLCLEGWRMGETQECMEWLQQLAEEADHESNSEP